MPNVLAKGTGTRVISGARCSFMFNNVLIGFAAGCDGSEEIRYEPVDVLNKLEVAEHVPVGYTVTFRARVFRTIARGDGLDEMNPGSLKALQIFPRLKQILTLDGCDAVLTDQITGKVIFQIQVCKCASYNFDIQARGLVAQDLQFVGIRARDESEVRAA